jgi:hypothetical protein
MVCSGIQTTVQYIKFLFNEERAQDISAYCHLLIAGQTQSPNILAFRFFRLSCWKVCLDCRAWIVFFGISPRQPENIIVRARTTYIRNGHDDTVLTNCFLGKFFGTRL